MRKNFSENFSTIEVDEVTGEYMILLPEGLINELGWYEETALEVRVDGNDLVIEKAEEG